MKHIRFKLLVALVLVSKYVLKKVEGYDGDFSVNVAYGKPANQSSAYLGNVGYNEPNEFPYIASLAVDGVKTTDFHGNSCSHTAVGQSSPWWEVYLQGLYDVSSIKIYQRDDANQNSLEGFVVDGMQSDANYITINYSDPYSTGVITISLQPKRQLQSIRIRLPKDNAFICLCEVEVFADIDECKSRDSVCHNQGRCTNTVGNFTCQCTNGYTGRRCETDIDECSSHVSACLNQGRCTNTIGNFTCQCTNGYTGLTCETDIDECSSHVSACLNQGRCTNTIGNFKCQCTNGYTGLTCETDIDECSSHVSACLNQGRCTNTIGNFTCQCTNGYTGLTCETDIDECKSRDSVCHNQGRCTNTVGNFTCQCTNGYTGCRCETDIDECKSRDSVCHNQGRCTNTVGNFTCQCTNGYTGRRCETDIDECKSRDSVCHNQGRCTNTVGNFTCQCTNGYTGCRCETDIDECKSRDSVCHNQGRCTNTVGNFTCQCTNGYTGRRCETDIDECKSRDSVCHNQGRCTNTVGNFTCQCTNGYTGCRCETDIDECKSRDSVCHNQGRCTNTVGNFTCQCTNGYTGRRCETDIDECKSRDSVCHNQGRCTNTVGNFTCQCTNGYTGRRCETDIDECKSRDSVCHNQGRCTNTVGNFTCQCTNGYTGRRCETDIDECKSRDSVCHNQGRCTNTVGNFTCQCTNGYTGRRCETDIDECKTHDSVCRNQGRCTNTVGNFTCQCTNGYTGRRCETDIDECRRGVSMCHNQGRCTNTVGNFTCQCTSGYTGRRCETDIDECSSRVSACLNQGLCTNTIGNFSCQCTNGYTGLTCETDIDECTQAGICQYHGQCSNTDGSFSCNCSAGYNGTMCEIDIDECTQAGICQYHGQCSNTDGSFSCNCSAGYNGTMCENDIDECTLQDSACHNRGKCSNTEGSFECQCSNGYVGATCETVVPEQSILAGIAGGVTAAICLLIIGVIIAFIMYKRRTKRPEDKIVDTSLSEIRSSTAKNEHVQEVMLEKSIYADPKDINNPKQDPEYDESKTVYMNRNDNSRDYYSFTPQKLIDKHSVHVEDLAFFVLSRKKEPNLYEEEYSNLPDGLTKSYKAALLPENRSKNRYKNIYPYDDTRVKLGIWDTSNESDYINASYVNGFKTYHTYIAAQGPTKGILNDFWRMIWQTKCCKIVMLTNLIEEGKNKCEQYWPDEGCVEYGDIVIRLIQCETFSDFTIRTLSIGKKNGKSKGGKTETHQIIQFHFTAWPDRGVPRFASSLVHFRRKIHAAHTKQQAEGPMIVHCSAGIGRTGTFLSLDYLLEQAKEVGYINVVRCLETIRKQRVNLVQTLGQYIFLHESLLEALTCTNLAVSTSEFQETHKKLTEIDKSTKKRMLDDEFEKLPMYVSDPEDNVYENAKNMENRRKNRYSNILPDKNHCPFLNVYVKGRDSYINAVFLPAYKENNIFIITQTPLENTIVDFWRMVYQFEVGSIVMLNTLSEMKEEERYWTEEKKMLEIGPFRITLESKSCDDISTNYTMLLHYNNERRRVLLSRATYWADGKPVPMSPTAMLKQIDLIEKWQLESGSKPIIVHCMNGAERSGLFCVIAALLERTKIEQDVAVEQIIKQMRSRRPQIIPNVDQFSFCYDAMLAYLNTFDTYSKFTGL